MWVSDLWTSETQDMVYKRFTSFVQFERFQQMRSCQTSLSSDQKCVSLWDPLEQGVRQEMN